MWSTHIFSHLEYDQIFLLFSLLFASLVITILITFSSSLLYFKCMIKRFIRIQLFKQRFNPNCRLLATDVIATLYENVLCDIQMANNVLLAKILEKNQFCSFYRDRSIHCLSSFASIDEFREKISLTTYDDYSEYVDRMIVNGENNVLTSNKIVYFVTSSGTTGHKKLIPRSTSTLKADTMAFNIGLYRILMSLRSPFPLPEQRLFTLSSGKKLSKFEKSKNGIPIGALSLCRSTSFLNVLEKFALSFGDILPFDLMSKISDFETSAFIQLVFALTIPDLYGYIVFFAPSFIHSIKMIKDYFEEICSCISTANFDHSSIVRKNILTSNLKIKLNQALTEVAIEYGGLKYRLKRAEYIRKECMKEDTSAILHRLWPNLVYASTILGGSFSMYKKEIQSYCGINLPLINLGMYVASESGYGNLASIYTDEYFLLPTNVFFEFIREENIHEVQPKTFLISEIEPGYRYELVITTEDGLIRYRTGDIIHCTRFLSRADDLLPLPSELKEIPRIPLITIVYRAGTILNVCGEKATEEHIIYALQQTIYEWKQQGITIELCDFTSFPKLDAFPVHYVIFFEVTNKDDTTIKRNDSDSTFDQHLCKANDFYNAARNAGKLGPAISILVRSGTFSNFKQNMIKTVGVNPLQFKTKRLLKDNDHIQFFYDNRLDISS